MPWLLVESMDIYFMIGINMVLLGVLLYIKHMFNDIISMVRPPKQVEVSATAVRIKKLNTILTDTVAVEEEHTILMQHEYDGIRELDNNLPPWWVWGFYATIVFAIVYLLNYHVFRTGDLQIEEYDKEMAQAKGEIDAYLSKMAMNVDETNATLLTDPEALSTGKTLFEANCVACHNQKAEGNIGPNLTDDHWIYGPDVKDIFKTIKIGTPNGMPEHASKLNPIQLQQMSSYIISLPFTQGKEPQGKEYK
jgi:cytochrome c oxidase cbb3-type subunit 3